MKNKHFIYTLFVLTVPGLLGACGPMTIMDTASRSYIPIEGWVLELHRDVVIPPGRTRVFFQDGRVLPTAGEYQPHCQLTVRTLSEEPRTIHADRFVVTRVFGKVGETVSRDTLRLAMAGTPTQIADGGNGNGEGLQIYTYHMKLQPGDQPDVTFFVCGGRADYPAFADYPTVQDIRTSLGDIAGLVIPEGS